jgi:FkbM family methyltransferase
VYAFDPGPKHTALVKRNCEQNGFTHVTVFQNAVSAENGVAEFVISPRSAESRLNAAWDGTTGGEKVRVECVALDKFIETNHLRPPDVCKIDVEGAEVDVLRGMMQTLLKYKPVIVCDTHGTHKEVAAVLEEAGYWCGTMEHPDQPLSEAEYYAHALAIPAEAHVPAGAA